MPQTVDDLRGQWEVAQAKLQRTQTLLQYARIVAPFTGVITARFVDPGAFIPAATAGSTPQSAALVTLMDYRRVRVQVFVPEAEVPFIKNGVPAQVTVEELPGRAFPGAVTRFAHALDEATKTMLTEIEIPNPSGDLRPGAYASVRLEVERKPDALLVPVQALVVEKAGTFLFTVADGKAKKTPVQTGFNDGVNVEITQCEARPTGDPRRANRRSPTASRSTSWRRNEKGDSAIYDLRFTRRACWRPASDGSVRSRPTMRCTRSTCRPRCVWRGRRISIFNWRASG